MGKPEHGPGEPKVAAREHRQDFWRGREFGLGWEGEGQGWEVKVVEVKSVTDHVSMAQRAWLTALRDAGVKATVCRVSHETQHRNGRKR